MGIQLEVIADTLDSRDLALRFRETTKNGRLLPDMSRNSAHRPSSIYPYSRMATSLYGQVLQLSSVFFVSQVSRESSKQNNIQM